LKIPFRNWMVSVDFFSGYSENQIKGMWFFVGEEL
jgi:hypothetical protein